MAHATDSLSPAPQEVSTKRSSGHMFTCGPRNRPQSHARLAEVNIKTIAPSRAGTRVLTGTDDL
jgi:hypothetical protein